MGKFDKKVTGRSHEILPKSPSAERKRTNQLANESISVHALRVVYPILHA